MLNNIPVRNIKPAKNEQWMANTFSIRSLHTLLEGKDMIQELHRHNFYYVLFLEKGIGEHAIDFINFPINDHSLFFMHPGQVHQLKLKAKSSGYVLAFTEDFFADMQITIRQVLRKISSSNYYKLDKPTYSFLNNILLNISQEDAFKKERYEDVIKSNLHIFFITLFRQLEKTNHLPASSEFQKERYEVLHSMITDNIAISRQVAYYAKKLNMTAYQLNAITKSIAGKTCSEVINDYFILEAKRYLLATTMQVNEISWNLGIEDVSYFIRFFKKRTGFSPESFRKKNTL